MNIFYTSDLHLGHKRIIELCNRPFADLTEMHNAIISRWNATVSDTDIVMILGDLAMGTIRDSLELVRELNGSKFLVPGNHDRCFSGLPEKQQKSDLYTAVGVFISPEDCTYVSGRRLCHFPYTGDSQDEDRYSAHRPIKGTEKVLLHGHVHNAWVRDKANRQINVGVDVWDFTPVPYETISTILNEWKSDE